MIVTYRTGLYAVTDSDHSVLEPFFDDAPYKSVASIQIYFGENSGGADGPKRGMDVQSSRVSRGESGEGTPLGVGSGLCPEEIFENLHVSLFILVLFGIMAKIFGSGAKRYSDTLIPFFLLGQFPHTLRGQRL